MAEENNQSSIGAEVWKAAEAGGEIRRRKFETTINRVFGLPEAAGKLVEIGSDAVKAKATEIKDKAVDLKERTELKITETKDKMVERYETTRDNLISRVEAFKKRAGDKATELKNRAIKAGLETGLKIEDKIVAICELPANLQEVIAEKYEEKAVGLEGKMEATVAKQFAVENGLSEAQQRALETMLAKHNRQNESVAKKHGAENEKLSVKIEAAKKWSEKNTKGAIEKKGTVDKMKIFGKLLEEFNNK